MSFLSYPNEKPKGADIAIWAFALLILLFGLYFVIFGSWLILLGGSWYYTPCGLLLCISGIYLFRQSPVGAWTYLLAWALTIPWTIYEVGFNFWGWLPRLFGPTLLAIVVAAFLPRLLRNQKVTPDA
ncbi:glycerol dehydrogenase [Bombella apis]|uniref:glycerol dehydrogenase n=1 Tax=Bombella apis TaxID=1785988 RepID=UPI0023F1A3E9|nr:glycerol dehydrogenase [Bombella apis]MCT6819038.1 glycerol dehydrogenase [Bombella apis]MCT6844937.1 glycerol dehydrogenase [Bombella apis]